MPNWMTNFALILFILLVFTGLVTLADKLLFSKRRAEGEAAPGWIEYPKSFFPVILIVFMLRSFLVEPFKIPSGSMIPTLLVGDLILVNKYAYGVRLPLVHTKILDVGSPQRGDVMVYEVFAAFGAVISVLLFPRAGVRRPDARIVMVAEGDGEFGIGTQQRGEEIVDRRAEIGCR